MSPADEKELNWWRKVFACRFRADNLPRPGDALYGHRFHLTYEDHDDGLVPYIRRRTPPSVTFPGTDQEL